MKSLCLWVGLLGSLVWSAEGRAGRSWCTASAPPGQYNFCDAYNTLPIIMRSRALASAFVDKYWAEIAGRPNARSVTKRRKRPLCLHLLKRSF